ncbi:flagellar assembly protein FliH [Motilimonas sp. E26]|uniref:flagellar assembly protein FliH n=1 Tax=Motilimonas sp. E26 TaxID=2865674 RepID=UPI001E36B501|nr:flagellar assembly protein FliH [Motilimonas sp. E26]MCE0556238.1 flagellar assembly protein FliH [Motilimonas sp. E26]
MPHSPEHDSKPELWQIPEVEEPVKRTDTNALNMPPDWFHREVEEEIEELPPEPPSLEEIEAIREDAYQEGFEQGREAGFEQGEAQGKAEGLAKGHAEGLAQGIAEGLAQGADEIAKQSAIWAKLTQDLCQPVAHLDQEVEQQLVNLVLQLTQHIVKTEVTTNPKVILGALKQAIDVLPFATQTAKLHFHPDDIAMIETVYSAQECEKRGWSLIAEPSLQRGDCQVKTELSSVDYPLEMRINQVLKQFLTQNNAHIQQALGDAEKEVQEMLPDPLPEPVHRVVHEQENTDEVTSVDSTELPPNARESVENNDDPNTITEPPHDPAG